MPADTDDAHRALLRLHPSLVHNIVNSLGWKDLRPQQDAAVDPILDGDDVLLLAPTAGGKTEAAIFPALSALENGRGDDRPLGLAILYICPIKALLNNLEPRLTDYASWLGRRVGLWHGDTPASARKHILWDPPDLLLTTPESIEAMLISTKVDHRRLLAGVRTVIVDEVHAFAGDDRGWHLLALLERLSQLSGRPVQRIGLSATVGNPDELLGWLRGSNRGTARVVGGPSREAPATAVRTVEGDVELDYVGGISNAAKVIATLHTGEKRLVFCDSRRVVEELGAALRERGVTTFLSHASLSLDERRRAEAAFATGRNCVIVATSTLELGIDVGDLDRVIQIDAPSTVSSFLQRLGRTGRRPDTTRNALFLTLDKWSLARAAGLLTLWGRGYVEPVSAPPNPRHIAAQQLMALCLQEGRVGRNLWAEWWKGVAGLDRSAEPIVDHLVRSGFLEAEDGMLFIGAAAEREFGRRHFMEMTSVFTAAPEFTVFAGRAEIGRIDPALLSQEAHGPRVLLLAGRSWKVTATDWPRRRCFVEAAEGGGSVRWNSGPVSADTGRAMAAAVREALLGTDPPVRLTKRARTFLAEFRNEYADTVVPDRTAIVRTGDDVRWWTWAGWKANATLSAWLEDVTDPRRRFDDYSVRLRADLTPADWSSALETVPTTRLPRVQRSALDGLKFTAALPEPMAAATFAERLADCATAAEVASGRQRFVVRESES